MRILAWALWTVVWTIGFVMMGAAGMIVYGSIWTVLLEAAISCFAATVMLKSRLIFWLGIIYLVGKLISGFSIVSIFCFTMSIALLYLTHVTREKKA